MAKVAYILLCHKDPEAIIAQAQRLTAVGDCISIHFDARAPASAFDMIKSALADDPNVTFARKRIKCGWGEWSLVQATIYALRAAVEDFPRCTHFYMLSGDCMSIKTAEYAHKFLDENDKDFIESFDYFESDWIKTGLKEERLIYRHWFNERTQKFLFYQSFWMQRRLGIKRECPADLQIMIGSQWWCLRRNTAEMVLKFCDERRDILRFFSTTWIPDETFFQTVVRHLIPGSEIEARTLTFLIFSDYGMPATFYNDHYDLLLSQNYLFARKISVDAKALRKRLGDLYADSGIDFKISNEGRSLFSFLTSRGREGRRFSPRFWETESTLGRERELMIVTCKKWHVAKRLLDTLSKQTDLPVIEYLFDEAGCPMPDLGGLQKTLEKRTRHRRSLMRMLFDYYGTKRLVVCMDPHNLSLMKDFDSDRSTTKVLEIQCDFSDDYLLGHAMRNGLAGPQTPPETIATLLPTIRSDVYFESDRLKDAGLQNLYTIAQDNRVAENVASLSAFFSISEAQAQAIAETEHLFAD